MKRSKQVFPTGTAASITVLLAAIACVSTAQAADFKLTGDISEAISMNMQDPIETPQDDKNKLSMARTTVHLNLDATLTDNVSFVGKFREVRESNLQYLKDLDKIGGNIAAGGKLSEYYSRSGIREAYLDMKYDRFQLRLGKQQVAWGETDFFQSMDMVHGYDFTWRSFLEPANEELRKPLVMANFTLQIPEVDGKAQLLVRPGRWNRDDAVGNTYDVIGGRWANQPNKGTDFRGPPGLPITPYNYRQSGADAQDDTWGIRWSGSFKEINYSLSYLKTFNSNPVISPAGNLNFLTAVGAPVPLNTPSGSTPFKGTTPIGLAGEIIYPKIELYGLTAAGYSAAADAVFSTEVSYIRDYAYNYGYVSGLSGVFGPGFDGLKQKNLIKSMFRMDKTLPFVQSVLGAEKPAFFSVQLFDTWIRDFKDSENLVQLVGFGQPSKEHSSLLTFIFALSYANGTINPELVAGHDLSYGGGFIVPSVAFQYGKDWRLKIEYDYFYNDAERNPRNAATERDTALFGYFAHNNQLYAKLTYQF
ncbi:MAG: LysR family transcriptional regulator [Proteobacteria bacterium]|nr:LysR family transcriptional regulator [Pseudomonadota bacterium]